MSKDLVVMHGTTYVIERVSTKTVRAGDMPGSALYWMLEIRTLNVSDPAAVPELNVFCFDADSALSLYQQLGEAFAGELGEYQTRASKL